MKPTFLNVSPAALAALALVGGLPTLRAQEETTAAGVAQSAPRPVPAKAPKGTADIERGDLRRHAFFLASDGLGGRHTGTIGQRMAATYIASQFEAFGFEPLGDKNLDGSRGFIQEYPVDKTYLNPNGTEIVIGNQRFKDGFAVVEGVKAEDLDVSGPLLVSEKSGRDLPEEMPENAIVLIIAPKARKLDGASIEMQFMMQMGAMQRAIGSAQRAITRGAKAVLLGYREADGTVGDLLNYLGLLPGKPLLKYGRDAGMAGMAARMKRDLPLVFLGPRATEAALAAGKQGGAEASVRVDVERDPSAKATNVCAVLRGSDPELSKQAVVFSAHMDHVGTRFDRDVFNGADDNASGSSALIEIAQAFSKGERPRRSVIFLSVSGEELGLWGSDYFAKNPTWPLDKIIANVNIDMIGRNAPLSGADAISICPSFEHEKYSSIGRAAAKLAPEFGLSLAIGDTYYERSDHYNFAERGVPVVFFCDGEHEDYHQVTDTADKLNYDKIERVARLAYWTGWSVAQAEGMPEELGQQNDWLDGQR